MRLRISPIPAPMVSSQWSLHSQGFPLQGASPVWTQGTDSHSSPALWKLPGIISTSCFIEFGSISQQFLKKSSKRSWEGNPSVLPLERRNGVCGCCCIRSCRAGEDLQMKGFILLTTHLSQLPSHGESLGIIIIVVESLEKCM